MRIGIDVGGTKIEGIVLDRDGREVARVRVPTPREDDAYDVFLAAVAKLIGDLESRAGARCSVGVGTPGFLSPDDRAHPELEPGVAERQGGRPGPVARRGAAGARRQRRQLLRAVRGHRRRRGARRTAERRRARIDVVFGATLGTGVGGGIVIDGRVLNGANGAAAEWSHTTLPFLEDGRASPYACFCGRPRCIESFVSGRGLAGAYRDARASGISTRPRSAAARPPATRPPTAPSTSTRAAWRARSPA